MCCFSQPVRAVGGTRIYARPVGLDRQAVAYSMRYEAVDALALVLPLPVPPGTSEDAVRWIDLEACPDLFARLDRVIEPPTRQLSRGVPGPAQALAVARVGAFEASFAPSAADLARLDPRFKLPPDVVSALPDAASLGFVIARLRPDATAMHPLAFELPRREPGHVVFPTLHVHDGRVHAKAHFDHALYLQAARLPEPPSWLGRLRGAWGEAPAAWVRSEDPVGAAHATASQGLLDPALPVARLRLQGRLANRDMVVPV